MNNQEKNQGDKMGENCPLCKVSAETLQNLKQGSQGKKQTQEKQLKQKTSFFRSIFKKS